MQLKASKYNTILLITTSCILLVFAVLNYMIDPLFQYHLPWFGLQPVIKKQRYQNAGIARNFEFDNAVIGNSLAENIRQDDLDLALGGKTIRLTAPGSHPIDWRLMLEILKRRRNSPKKLLLNWDPFIFVGSPFQFKHEWPFYLYDNNPFNDVNYLLNFDIAWDFTMNALEKNIKRKISSSERIYVWDDTCEYGREMIMSNISRQPLTDEGVANERYVDNAMKNLFLLDEYFDKMPKTEFIFFCSPFSILYWDNCQRDKTFNACKEAYYKTIEHLLKYPNVSVYFWSDSEMLQCICNLDYYRDAAHFDTRVAHLLCDRISRGEGLMTTENYKASLNTFFSYLDEYNYDSIWR